MALGIITAITGAVSGTTQLFAGATQGTAECGARPLFPGKNRDIWNECVANQQGIEAQEKLAKQQNIRTAIVVFAVVVFVVVIGLIIRKK